MAITIPTPQFTLAEQPLNPNFAQLCEERISEFREAAASGTLSGLIEQLGAVISQENLTMSMVMQVERLQEESGDAPVDPETRELIAMRLEVLASEFAIAAEQFREGARRLHAGEEVTTYVEDPEEETPAS